MKMSIFGTTLKKTDIKPTHCFRRKKNLGTTPIPIQVTHCHMYNHASLELLCICVKHNALKKKANYVHADYTLI